MNILAVGIATLDIINLVATSPGEDDEVRALSQRRARGGNATNTLVVLSQFGHQCQWAGVLPEEPDATIVEQDLRDHKIDLAAVKRLPQGKLPTSYITLSAATGSRSIVHVREMPEYRAEWFDQVSLDGLDWVHFEGRETVEIEPMLRRARASGGIGISLEVEKQRANVEVLFGFPDVLFLSRSYALSLNYISAPQLLNDVARKLGEERPLIICAWGDQGAWAVDREGEMIHAAAVDVDVVDTIGAGDAFNAAVIDALVQGRSLRAAIEHGCLNAGRKCAQQGLNNLQLVNCDGSNISLSA